MKIVILDFETTGKDPLTCTPLELGAYRYEFSDWPVDKFQSYIRFSEVKEIPAEITELTGITMETIKEEGRDPRAVLEEFLTFSQDAEYFVAHNINYDALVLAAYVEKFPDLKTAFENHPSFKMENWICSQTHIPYPEKYRCKILTHLALDHGITLEPGAKAHSALNDISLVYQLLEIYGVETALQYRDEPFVYIKAMIPPPWEDEGRGKDEARKAGYSYETAKGTTEPRFPKTWVKRVKVSQFENEKKTKAAFERKVIEPA